MAIYDVHPVYPHQAHLYWAYEPWKSIYVFQRLLITLLLVPVHVIYYGLLPSRFRPRPSWAIKQIVIVNFYRRIYKVTEVAGVTWGTRNPAEECDNGSLSETRFEWIPALSEELQKGVVVDEHVKCKRVGTFVWPRVPSQKSRLSMGLLLGKKHSEGLEGKGSTTSSTPGESDHGHGPDIEAEAGKPEVIGIFMHGGGYTQMSAHEHAGTSRIPRRLVKDKGFTEVYAVEYRLLQHDGCPAAIQDAGAVYAHIVINRMGAVKGEDGVYHYPTDGPASNPRRKRNVRVVLIGDSAGGNLVLGTARWIRDEGVLPQPDGLLLLSPSCDPSHAFPLTPSSYIPRPNAKTDYLVDTPEPRALLQRTFLGHHPLETIHSPYISPASPRVLRAYGHPVTLPCGTIDGAHLGLAAVGAVGASAVAIGGPTTNGTPTLAALANMCRDNEDAPMPPVNAEHGHPARPESSLGSSSGRSTPFDSPEPGADDASAPGGPARVNSELARTARLVERGAGPGGRPMLQSTMTFLNPTPRKASLRSSLFGEFPKTFVTVGDAERLELEITNLVRAMERDGVDLHVEWAKDAVHDMLMLAWWDENVREKVWSAIGKWVESL